MHNGPQLLSQNEQISDNIQDNIRIRNEIKDECIDQCKSHLKANVDKFQRLILEGFKPFFTERNLPLNVQQAFINKCHENINIVVNKFLSNHSLRLNALNQNCRLDLTNPHYYRVFSERLRSESKFHSDAFVNFMTAKCLPTIVEKLTEGAIRTHHVRKIHLSMAVACTKLFRKKQAQLQNMITHAVRDFGRAHSLSLEAKKMLLKKVVEKTNQDYKHFLAQRHLEVREKIKKTTLDLCQEGKCIEFIKKELEPELRVSCKNYIKEKMNAQSIAADIELYGSDIADCNLFVNTIAKIKSNEAYDLFENMIGKMESEVVAAAPEISLSRSLTLGYDMLVDMVEKEKERSSSVELEVAVSEQPKKRKKRSEVDALEPWIWDRKKQKLS